MSNHPNRGAKTEATNPTKEEVCAARAATGLSQTAAGALVHSSLRAWQDWESGERRMHPATWELFRIKAAELAKAVARKAAREQKNAPSREAEGAASS